jgi:hypothetical protein
MSEHDCRSPNDSKFDGLSEKNESIDKHVDQFVQVIGA